MVDDVSVNSDAPVVPIQYSKILIEIGFAYVYIEKEKITMYDLSDIFTFFLYNRRGEDAQILRVTHVMNS